jgi:hypothetical protein
MRYTANAAPPKIDAFVGKEFARIRDALKTLEVDTISASLSGSRLASQVVVAPPLSTVLPDLTAGVRPTMSVLGPGPDSVTWVTFDNYSADVGASSLYFRKSRNATLGLHTAVQSGDAVGSCYFWGSDGTSYINCAAMRITIDGAVSAGVVPGRISFITSEITSGTFKEWLRIESSGDLRKLATGGGNCFSVESSAGNQGVIKLGPNAGANYKYLALYSAAYAAREAYVGCSGAGAMEIYSEVVGATTTFANADSGATQRINLQLGTIGTAAAIGFLGTAQQAKKTVTGSRGGNAALASLLTQLANYGLITDSSTA